MVVGGFRGDVELARGFLGGPSRGDQTQNLDLARCETGEALRHVPAGGLTGAGVAMIATSVEAFMMTQNQCGDRLAFSAERRQRALSMIGMKVRRIGFALGQRPGAHPR